MDNTSQEIDDWAAAVVAATDWAQVSQIWQRVPLAQENAVLGAVAQRAAALAQAGDERDASRAQIWHAEMRQLQRERDEHPPYVSAIQAFVQAGDEAVACRVFASRQVVLQPYEAQVWLDRRVADVSEEERAHLTARAALLRTLRGVAPTASALPPPPTPVALPPAPTIVGNLTQAGQDIYLYSAHVEGSGSAVVINNMVVERRWQRPTPPTDIRRTIPRTHDLQQVAQLLADRGQVAISGPTTAAVQGMPGIGKTTLARQLAQDLDTHYLDGVLWQEIGPQISADQVQRILNQWAQVALLLPPSLDANVQVDPGAVRALFRDRRLLVILDDVWSLDAVRPLREALPNGVHLILTTRLETVTVGLGGGRHVLGILTPEEARALIALRLGWTVIPADHQAWCDALAQGVGYHTLALDVALGVLQLDGDRPEDWSQTAAQVVASLRTGQGFGDLQIPDGDREHHVERVLAYSYERMDAVAQERFRLLGALAEESSWATEHIAQLWQCDEQAARRQMNTLVNAALLSRTEQRDRWQQHSLLRGYALALLHREGTAEVAAAQHAAIYDAAMQQADAAQRHHTMLPDYPQVCHAVAWALDNDLVRAHLLIANLAQFLETFGFIQEKLKWSIQGLAATENRGKPNDIARMHVLLGSALHQAANQSIENRPALLQKARASYEKALRYYHLDTNPFSFAATQHNRVLVFREIASLSDEGRIDLLQLALEASDDALQVYRPDTDSLQYAMTQNNRAILFRDLAHTPGMNLPFYLNKSLEAINESLLYRDITVVSIDHATTQLNRALLLIELSGLPYEDQYERLHESIETLKETIYLFYPNTPPYATAQQNLAIALRKMANIPGQDCTARLFDAMYAMNEAVRIFQPDAYPLDFAMVQGEYANIYEGIASLQEDDKDRDEYRRKSIFALWEAFSMFEKLQHIAFRTQIKYQLWWLQLFYDTDFLRYWNELEIGPIPNWLGMVESDDLITGIPLLREFTAISNIEELFLFWAKIPINVEEYFIKIVENIIEQNRFKEQCEVLRQKLTLIYQLRNTLREGQMRQVSLHMAVENYELLFRTAEQNNASSTAWREVIAAGEQLLAPFFAGMEQVNWAVLHAHLGTAYHHLGRALHREGDAQAAVEAYDRALQFQPATRAFCLCSRLAALIALGRLDAAAVDLARARALEPDAPDLAALDARLTQVRKRQHGGS